MKKLKHEVFLFFLISATAFGRLFLQSAMSKYRQITEKIDTNLMFVNEVNMISLA